MTKKEQFTVWYGNLKIDEVIAYLRSLCEDINNLHNFIINVEHENQKEY